MLRLRHPFKVLALLVRQVFGLQLANAAQTHEQAPREANRFIDVRDVDSRPLRPQAYILGRQPLSDHLQVEVSGGQHDVLEFVNVPERFPHGVRFDV